MLPADPIRVRDEILRIWRPGHLRDREVSFRDGCRNGESKFKRRAIYRSI